jgi:mono/diheme cytochrome c family protein
MKNFKKIALWTLGVLVVVIGSALLYLKFALPNVGAAPEMKVEITPERVARGEYLANHVTVCIDCHSQRDWTRFSGPPKEGTLGMGGDVFDQKFGFPGVYYGKNITPAGISQYSDGELFRTITTGVDRNGKALFPVMPFHYYGQMDIEDIESIIAYIRSLKPIENKVPASRSDFPMNFIINTIPHKASFTKRPDQKDVVNYGKYLVTAASCVDCHTRFEKGSLVAGTEFGGGREFPFPDGSLVISANITPDPETGIGKWDEQAFVSLFRSRADSAVLNTKLNPGDFNSVMPWTMYGKMQEEDLKAIFAYLKTVKPINNRVEKFKPAIAQNSK